MSHVLSRLDSQKKKVCFMRQRDSYIEEKWDVDGQNYKACMQMSRAVAAWKARL